MGPRCTILDATLLEKLAERPVADATALRDRLVPELRRLLDEGRAATRKRSSSPSGTASPARTALSDLMDRVVQRRSTTPSSGISIPPAIRPRSERLAVVATGGYGRGTLAPGSDVDLLFLLPYKQTAWSESVVEAMLYVLWDLKLKVGHATRSVDECLREGDGRHDDPHLASRIALPVRRPGALRDARRAVRQGDRRRPRRPSSSTRSSRSAMPASPRPAPRAISSSRTSRTARAACAISTRCSGSRNTSTACASPKELVAAGLFTPEEFQPLRPLRGIPLARALPHAFRHRAAPRSA